MAGGSWGWGELKWNILLFVTARFNEYIQIKNILIYRNSEIL